MQNKLNRILNDLNHNLIEREETVAMCLLGALSGQNVFMLGQPGVGKSLIARRIAAVFKGSYFEYLMNKFSSPEDLFGPVSIQKLKQDEFERNIDGFLPSAEFAFLDEIWKSSPAILNSLLTISNERKYKNGKTNIDVPLRFIISASNETPPENQGLDALYDRFPIRLYVSPIADNSNRIKYLQSNIDMSFNASEFLTLDELKSYQDKVKAITINEQALQAFMACVDSCHEHGIYVSDRRQKQIIDILKFASAYSGHRTVHVQSMALLQHMLWEKEEERIVVETILEEILNSYLMPKNLDVLSLQEELYSFITEAENTLFYQEDQYKYITEYICNDYYNSNQVINAHKVEGNLYLHKNSSNKFDLYVQRSGYRSYDCIERDVKIDTKSHSITYKGNTYRIQLEYSYKKGDLKANIDYKTLKNFDEKINAYSEKIEKWIDEYTMFSNKLLKNKTLFVVGSPLKLLEEAILHNKAILEEIKINIQKQAQKIEKCKIK